MGGGGVSRKYGAVLTTAEWNAFDLWHLEKHLASLREVNVTPQSGFMSVLRRKRAAARAACPRAYPAGMGGRKWGPLPGTRDTWIVWGGPGDPLLMFASDPETYGAPWKRIEHPSASACYSSVRDATKAVEIFVAVCLADLEGTP